MRATCVPLALCLLAGAFGQTPPAPDATLVAGATPSPLLATDVAISAISLALSADGTLYLSDTQHVWSVSPAMVLTEIHGPWEAGTGGSAMIEALAIDGTGNLLIGGWGQIWKLAPQGAITTIGGGAAAPSPTGSGPFPANSVSVVAEALAVDAQGNILVSSNAARVWKISPDGTMTAFAGSGLPGVPLPTSGPVPALQYGLISPGRLAADQAGNVYITDASGLLVVTPDGMLRQIRPGESPIVTGIAVDGAGNLYATLSNHNTYAGQLARVAPDGSLQILAGSGAAGFSDGCTAAAPGVPKAINAAIAFPGDLASDAAGNLYFADPSNGRVRLVTRDGLIHTVAGGPGGSFGGDDGPAGHAFLSGPTALALDSHGNLYVADTNNNRVRQIDPFGTIRTVAGSGALAGQDPACVATSGTVLSRPSGLAVDPAGNLYISDTGNNRVLKLATDGSIATIAGSGAAGAQLYAPGPLAFASGTLYIGDEAGVRTIASDGVIRSFNKNVFSPAGLAVDAKGDVFAGSIEVTPDGQTFYVPTSGALAAGPAGEIYSAGDLTRLDPDCTVTPLASTSGGLRGIALAPVGDLFVADTIGNLVWRIPARAPGGGSVPISVNSAGVVNGATLRPRTVEVQTYYGAFRIPITQWVSANENPAPGERIAIGGICLGPLHVSQGTVDAAGHYSTTIGDLQVLFNGTPAPLLSANPSQLMVVVPYEIAGTPKIDLRVQYHGQQVPVSLDTSATSVGIFPVSRPYFAAGSTTSLLITGAGQSNPPGTTGLIAGIPAPQPLAAVKVTVGGENADVLSAAAEPGTIGATRVTFRIPADVPPGRATITIAVGNSSDSISATIRQARPHPPRHALH